MAIREELQKLLFRTNEINSEVEVEGDNKLRFRSFRPKADIFKEVFKSFYKKRDENGVFYNDDKNKKAGYLTNVYGWTGILSLASDGSIILNEEQKKELINNVRLILDDINHFGFTLYPYIGDIDNTFFYEGKQNTLFNHDYPYTGALTWVISFLTSVKKAAKKEDPEINKAENRYLNVEPDLLDEINRLIARIVDHFNTSVIKTVNPDNPDDILYLGWSYTKECNEPSLFFTYSVLEAFSDFEDNLLEIKMDENGYVVKDGGLVRDFKESEADLKDLFQTRTGLNEVEQWASICESVANNIWKVYGKTLKKNFVDDKFLEGFGVITTDDILKMDHTNALFNNVFLVSSLLYGWVNVLNKEEEKEIVSTMEIALQNVQRAIDSLKRKNMEYIVETYTIPFINLHNRYKDTYIRKLNYLRIDDTTLLPMLIKANNTIAVYITRYPVKKMDELFEEIFDETNISENEVVWDDKGYDVKITERYIEAINQFYNYYVAYEEDYTIGFETAKEEGRRKGYREGINYQRAKNRAELEQKEVEKQNAIKSVREEYSIENILMARMNELVEQKIVDSLEKINNRLSKHNWNSKKKKEINTYEDKLEALVISLVENYIASKVDSIIALEGNRITKEDIIKILLEDFKSLINKPLDPSTEGE